MTIGSFLWDEHQHLFIWEGDYEFSPCPQDFDNINRYAVCCNNMLGVFSLGQIRLSLTRETTNDDVGDNVRALLIHPRENMVKTTIRLAQVHFTGLHTNFTF